MASLVHPSQEEEVGQEEAQAEVQVQPGVLTAKTSTQQKGGDGQGQAQQGDDHAQLTDDMQSEIHLGVEDRGGSMLANTPTSRQENNPTIFFYWSREGQ